MMSKNLRSFKRFMATAAHKAASNSGSCDQIKLSTLPSGIVLASVDAEASLARIAVTIRAGSRYEPEASLGISHTLRSAAGLSTKNFSNFGITRNIEYHGGSLSVIGQRDTITYLLEAHNEEGLVEKSFGYLADTLSNPEFLHWELSDNIERMKAELSIVEESPHIQLAEALHKAAFKGGLRKSLYCPKQMLGKHTTADLLDYVKKRFVSSNTAVVGYGIDHHQLTDMIGRGINFNSSIAGKCNAKYVGGELHLDFNSPLTYVALAAEGVGLTKSKDVLAASLFQTILGDGKVGRLNNAVSSKQSGRFDDNSSVFISAFNMNYEETGLLGINLIAPASQDVTALLKSAVKELKAVASSVTDAELAQAKSNLKTNIMIGSDNVNDLVTDLGSRLLAQGKGSTVDELCKEIDSITSADVKAIAGKIAKGKPSLATIGRNAPYLCDILE